MKNKIHTCAINRPDGKWFERHEKRMIRKVRSLWRKQRNWVIENVEKSGIYENSIRVNTTESEINAILKKIPHKDELATEIVAFMRIALKRGGKKIVKELDMKSEFGIDFDVENTRATQFLRDKENWELSNAAGNIDGTTKKGIKRVLVEAAEEGKSYNETAKLIMAQSKAGVFSAARAQMIAVREIGVAYEEGNAEVIEEFRMKYPARRTLKKWQTVNDSRVTPTHKANQEMGWIDYSERFDGTGDEHAPGSDNPRCRCFTKYKIPKA